MKKLTKSIYFNTALLILVGMLTGCAGNTTEKSTTNSTENNSVLDSTVEDATQMNANASTNDVEQSETDRANDISTEKAVKNDPDTPISSDNDSNGSNKEKKNTLSQYASEQIEYARVWRQLGPNQDLEHLIVKHISAGTPIDPDDNTSVRYPEDVIQLIGTRIVDGIVTYSGNGDGTINVYNVPLRWYGGTPPPDDIDKDAVRKEMEDIINKPKLVYVDPGKDEEIIRLIKLLDVY